MVRRGDIWWTSLGVSLRSAPGFRRPLLVVQADDFNESAIRTMICAVITSNLALAEAPGNVHLSRRASGLKRESVVNVSQLISVDKRTLTARAGQISPEKLRDVEAGLRLVLALAL